MRHVNAPTVTLRRGRAKRCRVTRNSIGWHRLALVGIVLIGFVLRLHGLAFGLPALYDQDEQMFVMGALRMISGPTLDPGWYGHPGTTTIVSVALMDVLTFAGGWLTGRFPDAEGYARAIYNDPTVAWLPGRVFMLFCGLVVIGLAYRLSERLFDRRVGLVVAALLAVAPLHIKYSQIIRTDMHATVFMLACMIAAVGIARTGRWRYYAWASVWLGLTVATKWPGAAVALTVAGGALAYVLRRRDERRAQFIRLLAVAPMSLAALFVASPYLFIHLPRVLENLQGEARPYHLGATGYGFFGNADWYVSGPLTNTLGIAGVLLALGGLVVAVRRSREIALVVGPPSLLFVVAICAQGLVWDRWLVPLLPVFAIGAGVAIVTIADSVKPTWHRPILAALVALLVVPMLVTTRIEAAERTNDTRRLASNWARAHFKPGDTVIVEQLAFDILHAGWRFLYPAGDAGCVDVFANLKAKIPYRTIEKWRGKRPIVDLGTINPAMIHTCAADWAIVVDYDRFRHEAPLYRPEIAVYEAAIATGGVAATFVPERGRVGGPIVRIIRMGGLARPPVLPPR